MGTRRGGREKPPENYVKLNVDAVLIILEKNDASGVVLHDNHGRQATAL